MGGDYIETVEIDVTCNFYDICINKGLNCMVCSQNVYSEYCIELYYKDHYKCL